MKILKRTMIIVAITLLVLAGGIFLFMQQAIFGKIPSGKRLERIEQSPNYRDGAFQNVHPTEVTLKDASFFKMLKDFFNKPDAVNPSDKIPSVKTDLKTIDGSVPTIVWFGHSSYLIRSKAMTILVDPVFSGNASPVSFFAKSFNGADAYTANDFPEIDVVVITHDHYDHLDYNTILELKSKTKHFIVSLGVGEHLEYWGIDTAKITELNWWEEKQVSDSVKLTATPARHFSGRGFQRGKSLWSSFVLNLNGYSIFIGGDSGYDDQFKKIGEKFGPFQVALLESGQYGKDWPYIHMMPEETVAAAQDLKAEVLMPVHWSKFALAMHDWNEPIKRLMKKASEKGLKVTTPKIGEPVKINDIKTNTEWWNF
jgi:L-ascorbate metabolism protein UlaG (beta-lactamase superfamily)